MTNFCPACDSLLCDGDVEGGEPATFCTAPERECGWDSVSNTSARWDDDNDELPMAAE